MKVSPPEEAENPGFIMTPMIDVVFQLLVFFMLVLNFSSAQVEKLTLPQTNRIEKINWNDPALLIANIDKEGIVKIGGREFYHPKINKDDFSTLESFFRQRRISYPDPTNPDFAKYPVLIRADRDTDWEHIQRLEQVATKEGGITLTMYSGYKEE